MTKVKTKRNPTSPEVRAAVAKGVSFMWKPAKPYGRSQCPKRCGGFIKSDTDERRSFHCTNPKCKWTSGVRLGIPKKKTPKK